MGAGEQQGGDHAHGGMHQRGVTRPMALHESRAGDGDHDEGHHGGRGSGHGAPYSEMRHHMLEMHHRQTLWVYWLLVILGVWMILSPATFSYWKSIVAPSGGRDLWLSDDARAWAMTVSDMVSGLLLVVFGWRSLRPNRPVSLWICCFVGVWLSFAPMLFWAPTAAAYLNSTLVGALVIALSVLIPGMPNMVLYMKMGTSTPRDWTYNPSTWPQRWILIVIALAGWMTSRYLAAYQMGYIDHPWEPFFGEQTRRVLDSEMSHMWPISDAALGATAYTFEFLMLFMGGVARWRTMPWMVLFFGILVIPLGLVHIVLVISQPVVVGAWCTLCLLAAALMLVMIPLTVDEVVAMAQHMVQAHRRGESMWHIFWKGGTPEQQDEALSPELSELASNPGGVLRASVWGMSCPWMQLAATALGVWLMFTPAALGVEEPASHAHHLLGALIITVSVIAMGEPVRMGRYLNLPLVLGLVATGWMLEGATLTSRINDIVIGAAIIGLSVPRGRVRQSFGTWDRFVR